MKRYFYRHKLGKLIAEDLFFKRATLETSKECAKKPYRYDVINLLINSLDRNTTYLEIGVRNPEHNFNKVIAKVKYSVDPGIEFKENPVDFQMTSDAFFASLRNGKLLNKDILFDVIFIDGLHLAEQVERDIINSLEFIAEDGYIVLHDCNPPTEWHARETFNFRNSPARGTWNGTTWKAFVKAKDRQEVFACCVDTDFGIGVISKTHTLGDQKAVPNPFYEFHTFEENRVDSLNLVSFETFNSLIKCR